MSVFRHTHRVTYAECTVGNHVYYARYLDILESARGEFFRSLGRTFLEWQTEGTLFPVIEATLRYKGPARYDDVLTVEIVVTEASGVRLSFAYRILGPENRLLVEGETRHVCTSLEERPKRIPAALAENLGRFAPETKPANDK